MISVALNLRALAAAALAGGLLFAATAAHAQKRTLVLSTYGLNADLFKKHV